VILLSLPPTATLAAALLPRAGLRQGEAVVGRFSNGELHARIETPVAGEECVLLGAVAPPDEDLLATLLVAHTLLTEGARRITALLPYLGYARHDKREPGKSLGTAWLGRLLQASGVQEVVTVDVHSRRVHDLFPLPVRSLSPAAVFAAEIERGGLEDVSVVAPDEGAVERCEAVRAAAGIPRPPAWLGKTRTERGVIHSALHGTVGPRAVIVDDILDTGGTLVSACEALARAGVRDIRIMVTHGLFTGATWQRLWSLGVSRIYCTDTTPPPPAGDAIAVLSIAPLLAADLKTPRAHGAS
jgi:ribose-phosphate pyrophosphokinase